MKCGLVGPSYQMRSLPYDAQRTVNMFPVLDQSGKDVSALYSRPGLAAFGATGLGAGRTMFAATNGRCFAVAGNTLYEVMNNGMSTVRGTIGGTAGAVTIAENGFQLAVCDGASLYIFTFLSNAFVKVVSAGLPSAATVTFLGGYFIVNETTGGIFHISKLYDGTTWAPLDFATAESSPDALLRVINIGGTLFLVGAKTIEPWANTGGLKFPFSLISGAKVDTGTIAPYSVILLDNSMFFVGRDDNGFGIVYRIQGFSPRRVSTEAIELRIQTAPSPASLTSESYQEDGHTFLRLSGGGMETSLVYDLSTEQWHEEAFLNDQGNYELSLSAAGTFAFGKYLVIDRRNGNIYQQSLNFNTDNGEEIARDRIFTHLIDENQRFQIKNLTVGIDTGVGTQTGLGADPKATLSISKDGGLTFPISYIKSFGKVGRYRDRVTFQRLGQARELTFRFRVTHPNPVRVSGAWFNTK